MKHSQSGFTLVELAIAMIIIGLLVGGAITTMSAQHGLKISVETKQLLGKAEEALIGFAIANGRLPCPAAGSAVGGWESPEHGGVCSGDFILPAKMLGLQPIENGFLIDPWGNPIRYEVAYRIPRESDFELENNYAFTSSDPEKIRNVMRKAPGHQPQLDGEWAVFKIYSLGRDPDDPNDNINLWLSPYKFYSRLSQAGVL